MKTYFFLFLLPFLMFTSCNSNYYIPQISSTNQSSGDLWTNTSGVINSSDAYVQTGRMGINTAPSINNWINIIDENAKGQNAINVEVYQNNTIYSPLKFTNHLITATGNPTAVIFDGYGSFDKDFSGISTMYGMRYQLGAVPTIAQTQGTRNIYGISLSTPAQTTQAGNMNQYGMKISQGGSLSYLGGNPTINHYGIEIIGADNALITGGTSNRYGLKISGYDYGTYDDDALAIWVNDGDTYLDGDLNVTGKTTTDSLILTTSVEEDLNFPIAVIQTHGVSNVPERDLYSLNFDDGTMEQCYTSFQLPHNRQAGSNLEPHFHWQTEDDTSGDVVWCIELSRANIGDSFLAPITQCTVSSSVSNSTKHIMSDEIILTGTTMTASAVGKIRIYRNATDSRDTYGADAELLHFDVHYYVDKLGETI